MFQRGSEWRKWDLHIHSPLSLMNNQFPKLQNGEPDWEKFVQKLESLDIAVLGITDYFSIEGYKILRQFKEKGRLANIHTILPNIEFRLNSVLSSRKDGENPRRLNYHVILSDEIPIKDIEEHFLHDISFYYEGNPQDKDDTRKLKLTNIEELGNRLLKEHKTFREMGLTALQVGAMQTVVDHEKITTVLNTSRFKGKYILVFPEELSSLIDWDGQDHHTRKGILQKSDMVFSSNLKTRQWCLGSGPYLEGENHFIQEFKTLKPCIHGSDAHKIDEVGHPCALRKVSDHDCSTNSSVCELRYCWIKADPTFEGFKQLLYEPSERVFISSVNPSPPKSNFTMTKIAFSESEINEELSLKAADLELNGSLVAVAGGKGSGKTALVDLIANCYFDRCNTEDKNSFVKRIADQAPRINTNLTFQDGSEFSKELTDDTFFEDSEITYIAQGELEKYIGDESDLDTYVRNLIFDSPQIKDSVKSYEFEEIKQRIEDLESQIARRNDHIENLEKKTSPAEMQLILREIKQKESDHRDIQTRAEGLAKNLKEENLKVAKEKQNEIAKQKARKDDLMKLRNLIQTAIDLLENQVPIFNQAIVEINRLLRKLDISETYNDLSYTEKNNLSALHTEVRQELTKIVVLIEKSQKELASFEAGIKEHAKLMDKARDLTAEVQTLKTKKEQLLEQKKALEKLINERTTLFGQVIEAVLELKRKYEEIIDLFSSQKAEVLFDLDFHAQVNLDSEQFFQVGEDVLDNRKVTQFDQELMREFETLFLSVITGEAKNIPQLLEKLEQLNEILRQKVKGSHAITIRDFYNFLYSNYLSVVPVVRYKKTGLNKLSLGQKATVLIKIYLAQGDKPIIIDSHDDHLDNEFIMEELVKAVRQAKQHRQVILVSNNGNVVINSDAEQIVIANREGTAISYMAGSIENPIIRDRALKVLEGGYDAFKKRQEKYRISP